MEPSGGPEASQKDGPFWLSHHHPDEYVRTLKLGPLRVCARCLGTYPTLFAALAAQIATRAPLEWRFDGPFSLGLLLPALVDWALGRFRPKAGSNAVRLITGVLLGMALGRTLYVHLRSPFPLWLVVQAAVVTAVAVPVMFATLRRAR